MMVIVMMRKEEWNKKICSAWHSKLSRPGITQSMNRCGTLCCVAEVNRTICDGN